MTDRSDNEPSTETGYVNGEKHVGQSIPTTGHMSGKELLKNICSIWRRQSLNGYAAGHRLLAKTMCGAASSFLPV